VKNRRKSAKEAKAYHLLFATFVLYVSNFQSNKIVLILETHFDKSISVSGSNNAGVWGRNFQPPEANGSLGVELPGAAAILQPFFKNTHF